MVETLAQAVGLETGTVLCVIYPSGLPTSPLPPVSVSVFSNMKDHQKLYKITRRIQTRMSFCRTKSSLDICKRRNSLLSQTWAPLSSAGKSLQICTPRHLYIYCRTPSSCLISFPSFLFPSFNVDLVSYRMLAAERLRFHRNIVSRG
jgi:hypothetical protein